MHELKYFFYGEKKNANLRGNPKLKKQRAHNKPTTEPEKPSYHASKNAKGTINHELVGPKVGALFSFG